MGFALPSLQARVVRAARNFIHDAVIVGKRQIGQQHLRGAGRLAHNEQPDRSGWNRVRGTTFDLLQATLRTPGNFLIVGILDRLPQQRNGSRSHGYQLAGSLVTRFGRFVPQLGDERRHLVAARLRLRALAEEFQERRAVRHQAGHAQGLFVGLSVVGIGSRGGAPQSQEHSNGTQQWKNTQVHDKVLSIKQTRDGWLSDVHSAGIVGQSILAGAMVMMINDSARCRERNLENIWRSRKHADFDAGIGHALA